nr:hypothetical protein [Tanacetum cinerariifolium]
MSTVRLFSLCSAAARLSSAAKSSSTFRSIPRKPISHRIFRCPVELSVCLETFQPFHTVTASALMTSMLTQSPRSYAWLSEDKKFP